MDLLLMAGGGIPRRGLVCFHDAYFPNVLLQSEAFGTSPWSATRASVSPNAVACPHTQDGFADKLVEDSSASATHYVSQNPPLGASGQVFTVGVVAKAAERSWCRIAWADGETKSAYFDLVTPAVGTTANCTAAVAALGSGWVLCTMTGTLAGAITNLSLSIATGNGTHTYTGNGTSGLFIARAQLYPSATLPPYAATTDLQSIPDRAGAGLYPLQRGSSSGADSNDPTVLGPGLQFTTDDYCLTGNLAGVYINGPWTRIVVATRSSTTGYPWTIAASNTTQHYHGVKSTGAGTVAIASRAGAGAETTSSSLSVSTTSWTPIALRHDGAAMTLTRLDTGASVSLAGQVASGTPRICSGAIGASTVSGQVDSSSLVAHLFHNRALSDAEIQRVYRSLKSLWASRPGGVSIL